MHHWHADREIRQKYLLDRYMIKCDCLGCIMDYPKLEITNIAENDVCIRPALHLALVGMYDRNAIKEVIPRYCKFLNANSTHDHPDNKIFVAEKILSKLWTLNYLDKLILPLELKVNDIEC